MSAERWALEKLIQQHYAILMRVPINVWEARQTLAAQIYEDVKQRNESMKKDKTAQQLVGLELDTEQSIVAWDTGGKQRPLRGMLRSRAEFGNKFEGREEAGMKNALVTDLQNLL